MCTSSVDAALTVVRPKACSFGHHSIAYLLALAASRNHGITHTASRSHPHCRRPFGCMTFQWQQAAQHHRCYTASRACRIAHPDDPDRGLRDGEEGVLLVRGPGVFSRYWNNEADTKEAFHDGWYNSGAR